MEMESGERRELSTPFRDFVCEISRDVKLTDAYLVGSMAEVPFEYLFAQCTNVNFDQLRFVWGESAIPVGKPPPVRFNDRVFHIETVGLTPGYARLSSPCSPSSLTKRPFRYIRWAEVSAIYWTSCNTKTQSKDFIDSYSMKEFLAQNNPFAEFFLNFKQITMNVRAAITCPYWPTEAKEWITRTRTSGWPSESLVKEVAAVGCHLVQARVSNGHHDDTLFSFSFALAEVMLIRTWSPVQKYIYHLLRLIRDDAVRQLEVQGFKSVLETYHFKTLMFWACETQPEEFWEESRIKSSIGVLLCQMIEYIVDRSCPNFFIPSNNMFDRLPKDFDVDNEIIPLLMFKEQGASRLVAAVPIAATKSRCEITLSNRTINIGYLCFQTIRLLSDREEIRGYSDTKVTTSVLPDLSEFVDLYDGVTNHLQLVGADKKKVTSGASGTTVSGAALFRATVDSFERAMMSENKKCSQRVLSFSDSLLDILCSMMYEPSAAASLRICSEACQEKTIWNNSGKDKGRYQDAGPRLADKYVNQISRDHVGSTTADFASKESPKMEEEPEQCGLKLREMKVQNRKEPSSDVQAMLNLFIHAILPILDKRIPKTTYFTSAAYRANFYYATCKDYQKALQVCDDALRRFRADGFPIKNYLSDQICSVVLTSQWIPLFDQHIQAVYGFLVLSQMLKVILGREDTGSVTERHVSSPKLTHYLSPFEFLEYTKLQCEKQLIGCTTNGDCQCLSHFYRPRSCSRRTPLILYAALRASGLTNTCKALRPKWNSNWVTKFHNY